MRREQTTYLKTQRAEPKRLIQIEVGDSKQPMFLPQFKTAHWGNESNFSARLVDEQPGQATVADRGGRVEWRKGPRTARFYELPGYHDGGFEFEVELAERPASNVLHFTIQTKGLRFFYQGELDPDNEEDARSRRAENVIGSYAVYHAEKSGNFDHIEYLAGKAFHIYRPHAIDARGKQVWCDLNIDEWAGVMTITVPQEYLDHAVYPVIVDPTIGYTTAGGTPTSITGSSAAVCSLKNTYTAGTGEKIVQYSIYTDTIGNGDNGCYMTAYTIDGTPLPTSRLAAGTFISITNVSQAWNNSATVSQSLSASTLYNVAFGEVTFAYAAEVYRDGGVGTNRSTNTAFTLDATWTSVSTSTVIYSMYATVTAPSLPPAPRRALQAVNRGAVR